MDTAAAACLWYVSKEIMTIKTAMLCSSLYAAITLHVAVHVENNMLNTVTWLNPLVLKGVHNVLNTVTWLNPLVLKGIQIML